MDQPEEKILHLRTPVSLGKGAEAIVYETLTLREPTAGELEKATRADTNIGVGITLISLVAGIPRPAAEKLSNRDFQEANEYLGGFTVIGPTSGEAP